jgi:uncharacterized membrane protein
MKYLLFFSLLLLSALSSCKHAKKITPDVAMESDSSQQNIGSNPSKDDNGRVFSGLFVVGRNVLSFRECDHSERDFAVVDSTGEMKQLYKTVFLHSPAFPYEYVYVQVRGELAPASESLSVQGFDSVLTVEKVLTFEQKNYQNSCIPYDFWVLGDNWSLQISMKEGVLVLKDFSSMMVYVFEYFPPANRDDEVITYASNNYAMQASIKAEIRKEPCHDVANNQFQYSASVLVNGKRYSGCAIKGNSL